MTRLKITSALVSVLLVLGACNQNEPGTSETPIRVNAAVAAVVNGEYILASEVELEAAAQGKMEVGEALPVDDPVFEEILEQLIDQKLLAQEAVVRNLDMEENARHRLQAARERILGNILVENLVAEEVDEAAVLEMYRAQTELQQLGEEVLVRHIQVNRESEARELFAELQGGEEFAALAFAHSIDRGTNAEGGLIGYILPEEMPEPFPNIINRTAIGATSEPFASDVGWHIIKVEDRRQEEPATLDEMRPKIVQFLTLSEISQTLTRLRSRAELEKITDGNLNLTPAPSQPEPAPEDETAEEPTDDANAETPSEEEVETPATPDGDN